MTAPTAAPHFSLSPADYVAAIRANVDRYYRDEITYAEFTRRAFALWDEVPKIMDEAVCAILRQGLPKLAVAR